MIGPPWVADGRAAGLAHLHHLTELFELAARAQGGADRLIVRFGDSLVEIRVCGRTLLENLSRALPPRESAADATPDATVLAFDLAAAGLTALQHPWRARDLGPRGEVCTVGDAEVRLVHDLGAGAVSAVDLGARTGIYVSDDVPKSPWWERAAPLRTVLHWLLGSSSQLLAHGAVVGDDDGAVLLAGVGGSGKSTTALACVAGGLRYVGDDYVLLDTGSPTWAHALYVTAKLSDPSLELVPGLDTFTVPGSLEDEKRIVEVARAFPNAMARSLPVTAIVLPRIAPDVPSHLAPCSPVEALRALAPTTIFQMPGDGAAVFEQLATFVRGVPSHVLTVGGDGRAPAVIRSLLARVPPPSQAPTGPHEGEVTCAS